MIALLDSSKSEEEVPHEAFKGILFSRKKVLKTLFTMYLLLFTGALYVILGHKEKTILTKHNWETCLKVWPALVLSRHSEKPSVSSLLDRSMKTIQAFIGERKIKNKFREIDSSDFTSFLAWNFLKKILVH